MDCGGGLEMVSGFISGRIIMPQDHCSRVVTPPNILPTDAHVCDLILEGHSG